MNKTNVEEFKKHLKAYLGVFYALLILTVVTVLASRVDFGMKSTNVVIALIIATVKAGLVAGWFMHLKSEKKPIYRVLCFTFFFFAALMFITLWAAQEEVHSWFNL